MEKKLGIYARQSREKETNGSIENQIALGIKKAVELNLGYEIYQDKDASAAYDTLDNRPDFIRLLNDIENGVISAVFVIDESRLTRNQSTKLIIKSKFSEFDVIVHTAIDGITDFNDLNSEFYSDLKTLFASRYVRETSYKICSVLEKRVEQGKIHTGVIKPYGYTPDKEKNITIDEEEAAIVREIYQMCLLGYGTVKIAKILNERQVLTKTNKLHRIRVQENKDNPEIRKPTPYSLSAWAGNTVLGILKNPLYKGERFYKGKYYTAPNIVSIETWEAAQAQIKKNTNAPGLSKHQYLLKGLCVCGRCGSDLCGRTRESKRDNYYYCSSKFHKSGKCGIRSINITTLDSIIWTMISSSDVLINQARLEVNRVKNPDFLNKMKQELEQHEKNIQTETNVKSKIFSMLKKDLLSEEEAEKEMFNSKNKIKEHTLKANELRLRIENNLQLLNKIEETDLFIQQWEKLVFDENFEFQYRIVRMFIEKIIIDFDDNEELYTITAYAKLPESYEIAAFKVSLKGDLESMKCSSTNGGKVEPSISRNTKLRPNIKQKESPLSNGNEKRNPSLVLPPNYTELPR